MSPKSRNTERGHIGPGSSLAAAFAVTVVLAATTFLGPSQDLTADTEQEPPGISSATARSARSSTTGRLKVELRGEESFKVNGQEMQLVYRALIPEQSEHAILIEPRRGTGSGSKRKFETSNEQQNEVLVLETQTIRFPSADLTDGRRAESENPDQPTTSPVPTAELPGDVELPGPQTDKLEPGAVPPPLDVLGSMTRVNSTHRNTFGTRVAQQREVGSPTALHDSEVPNLPIPIEIEPTLPLIPGAVASSDEKRRLAPETGRESTVQDVSPYYPPTQVGPRPSLPVPATPGGQQITPVPETAEPPVPDLPSGFAKEAGAQPLPVESTEMFSVEPGHHFRRSESSVPTDEMSVDAKPDQQITVPSFGHSFFRKAPGTSGFRATVEADAGPWMEPFKSRVMNTRPFETNPVIPVIPDIPDGYAPWWNQAVKNSLGVYTESHPVDVSSLLQDAMVYSPQVIAIKAEPEVQYRVVTQEEAKFDWSGFLETTYDNLNEPVGSDLIPGNGQDRFLTQKVLGSGGFRRRTLDGGEVRIAQEMGHENQNSQIFVPNNQGATRLELSFRQPLMDGAGRSYNESEVILARIQANTSEDEVVAALQDHLTEVTEAYWSLYRARAEFFQRQKLLASAQDVLHRLEGRSKVDTIPRQVLRARAAVARARTRIQRTLARVRDSEAQLRLRVNSPAMLNGGQTELMPTEEPGFVTDCSDLQTILHTALTNRPDISEAIRRMRAAGVRLGVSKTELLPRLDLLVETYVADLAADSNVSEAFRGQFADNRPGYTVGLEFEVPIGNRAARAKYEQRQWELQRSINVFRATVEKSLTDVEIARREVQTAYSEVLSRYQSMMAADRESLYLSDRFKVLPSAEDSATLLLEDLLDSFERLADEEAAFVQAQVDHAIALIKLKKEMGTLLRSRNSRPELNATQKQWMTERVQFSSDRSPDVRVVEQKLTLQPPTPVKPASVAVESSGNIQIGYSVIRDEPSAASGRRRPSGVPIPRQPTTWRRPAPSGER